MSLNVVRHIVQCLVIALFLSPLVAELLLGIKPGDWWFYGTLSSSTIFGSVVVVDPFAALESVAATRQPPTAQLLAGSLVILLVYGLIRGRVFCGWVCPVNLILEVVEFIARPLRRVFKRGRSTDRINRGSRSTDRINKGSRSIDRIDRRTKIVVAAGVLLLSALCGLPVFEIVSPIGSVYRGLVLGAYVGIWSLLAIVILEIFFPGRLWCRKLCPLGGFYQLIGRLGFLSVKSKSGCTACGTCRSVCIADPSILDPVVRGKDNVVRSGDCMLCGKCQGKCPQKLLSTGFNMPFSRK